MAMKRYRVKEPLKLLDQRPLPGEVIELEDAHAAELLALRAIAPLAAAKPGKPPEPNNPPPPPAPAKRTRSRPKKGGTKTG